VNYALLQATASPHLMTFTDHQSLPMSPCHKGQTLVIQDAGA